MTALFSFVLRVSVPFNQGDTRYPGATYAQNEAIANYMSSRFTLRHTEIFRVLIFYEPLFQHYIRAISRRPIPQYSRAKDGLTGEGLKRRVSRRSLPLPIQRPQGTGWVGEANSSKQNRNQSWIIWSDLGEKIHLTHIHFLVLKWQNAFVLQKGK